jgi:predicted nucleotide-binding protein
LAAAEAARQLSGYYAAATYDHSTERVGMKKEQQYRRSVFNANVVQEALETFRQLIPAEETERYNSRIVQKEDGVQWSFDNDDEYFAEYRRGFAYSLYRVNYGEHEFVCSNFHSKTTKVSVGAPSRQEIERVFDIFEKHRLEAEIPQPPAPPPAPPPPPVVFIGHGRSGQWRDLKDHLQDQHGYQIQAYEIGARAGHVIRDILEEMLTKSSFAVLVMTAEDEMLDEQFRARQNVVHEIGLFQGKLGFSRAIVLVEEGVEVFSNLQGIQQIRFSKGNIRETYGDVLATLRREFGHA